ncbi:hypothetical protein Ldro_1686 [Legionella drozanskii LLAP-1]|uniref:Uncharacterized protein n=2 Tax=Legionellaceae TaxID=444 RepID=A0A0W0SXQ0_9GAMM|nr:hypothetical protein Ldro_1686 [Legionella drozanskii LLAP-1]PJE09326.1 MAG: hypothetical protein CK430_11325 [Legionella sp.]
MNLSTHSKVLNFFSTQAGKEKIQTGRLSQIELFIYFYLIILFDYFEFTQQTLGMIEKTPRPIDYLNIWEMPIFGVIGLLLLFFANGGSKGNNFLNKYFTFSFTVGIKYYFLYSALEYLPNYFPTLASNYYEISISILINIVMVSNIGLRIYQTKT